eukprot:TRINITY_DN25532_c0_g1_i1.p1 TRINITY_DN25532_c0_g1~~TRINITY_DN25532_c0_g1_i1.p1  ORF type:complete len:943 (-),score=139.95 TRINITY_DN25532_c0_g1_i1:8-2509(-)
MLDSGFYQIVDNISEITAILGKPNLHCMVQNPLSTYLVKISFLFLIFLVVMVVHHFWFSLWRWRPLNKRVSSLIGAIGTTTVVFFITIVTLILEPFRCIKHPNGLYSTLSLPTTQCWSEEHVAMIRISVAVMLAPVGFIALCIWAVVEFQKRLRVGDKKFLRAFAFLFYRFRTGAQTSALWLTLRGVVLGVSYTIVATEWPLLVLMLAVLVSLFITSYAVPWRLRIANTVDLLTHLMLALLIFLTAMKMKAADVLWILEINMVLVLISFVVACVGVVYARCIERQKKYEFFLCHYKAQSGALARLIKMFLMDTEQLNGIVFLDSDNLSNLDDLFHIVSNEVETLVVLCTEGLLRRPWCVGEITMAHVNKLQVNCIRFIDFVVPEASFIKHIAQYLSDHSILEAQGISLSAVQKALTRFVELPHIELPEYLRTEDVTDLVLKILQRSEFEVPTDPTASEGCWGALTGKLPRGLASATVIVGSKALHYCQETGMTMSKVLKTFSLPDTQFRRQEPLVSKVIIVSDDADREAVALARILYKLLCPHFAHKAADIPQVLVDLLDMNRDDRTEVEIPQNLTKAVIIFTKGCLTAPRFLTAILLINIAKALVVPIIANEDFSIPSQGRTQDLELHAERMIAETGAATTVNKLVSVVVGIFQRIAIFVNPHASDALLRTMTQQVVERLQDQAVCTRQASMPTEWSASEGSSLVRQLSNIREESCSSQCWSSQGDTNRPELRHPTALSSMRNHSFLSSQAFWGVASELTADRPINENTPMNVGLQLHDGQSRSSVTSNASDDVHVSPVTQEQPRNSVTSSSSDDVHVVPVPEDDEPGRVSL